MANYTVRIENLCTWSVHALSDLKSDGKVIHDVIVTVPCVASKDLGSSPRPTTDDEQGDEGVYGLLPREPHALQLSERTQEIFST